MFSKISTCTLIVDGHWLRTFCQASGINFFSAADLWLNCPVFGKHSSPCQRRIQKFGIGGGRVGGGVWGGCYNPSPENFLKILSKNNAFCAKFSLVLRCVRSIGGRPPLSLIPLNPPLLLGATAVKLIGSRSSLLIILMLSKTIRWEDGATLFSGVFSNELQGYVKNEIVLTFCKFSADVINTSKVSNC